MIEPSPPPAWTQSGWKEKAQAWIRTTLEALDLPLAGEIQELQQRPWSAVMVAPTAQGAAYFKATDIHGSNEPALMQALYRWRPDCMVQVLAVDHENRWLLMADEGVRLRTLMQSADDLHHWEHLLPLFAEVQIEMIDRGPELLDLGIIDHRLERLPGMFAKLMADRDAVRLRKPDGLSPEQYARLLVLVPKYAEMCAHLAELLIPETLHHDDFHDGNVLVRDRRYTFSDWGDSCLAHPFFSMVINLRGIADRLGLPDEATESPDRLPVELTRLRDLYLEPWTRFAPLPELRRIFPLAWRVGMVNRALSWYEGISHYEPLAREKYGYTIPAWLGEFLLAW